MQSIVRRLTPLLAACALLLAFAGSAFAADRYVALGDSYSSGTGTRSYTLNSGCQRGIYAYPYLLSQQRPNTALTFVACSGAKTTDVMNNQISSVTSDTKIVTITIGGNDAGFSSVITSCALPLVELQRRHHQRAELHPQHAAGPAQHGLQRDQDPGAQRHGRRARLPAPVHGRGLQRGRRSSARTR